MNPDQPQTPQQNPPAQQPQQSEQKVQYSSEGKIESFGAGESMIADTRRHPFGLYVIYLQIVLALGLSLIIIFAFLPSVSSILGVAESTINALAAVFGLFAIIFGLVFIVLATKVYMGNRLILSNKNVTHIKQVGIFNKHTAELSLSNVEDVSVHKTGIFPSIFNYGQLKIETAGEQRNFEYSFCPKPDAMAQAILDARTQFTSR